MLPFRRTKHNKQITSFNSIIYTSEGISPAIAFEGTLEEIRLQLSDLDNNEDKISLLDYYIRAFILELSSFYSLITTKDFFRELSKDDKSDICRPVNWLPNIYIDNKLYVKDPITGNTTVELKAVNLIALITKSRSVAYFMSRARHNKAVGVNDESSLYVPYLNLLLARFGDHHRLSAYKAAERHLKFTAKIYDITSLFEYTTTDGSNWISINEPSHMEPVYDYRFAIIYSLAKIKYEYETQQSNNGD